MEQHSKRAFERVSLGAENRAYAVVDRLDPEYFRSLKNLYVDATFDRKGALPRKTKELIMVGITCALRVERGIQVHSQRAIALGATPQILKTGSTPAAMR